MLGMVNIKNLFEFLIVYYICDNLSTIRNNVNNNHYRTETKIDLIISKVP